MVVGVVVVLLFPALPTLRVSLGKAIAFRILDVERMLECGLASLCVCIGLLACIVE